MMPTTDPAMTKAMKMNKIGVKRTKRNDSVYKEKLKKKKLEKKLEDEDSDYEPNLFEAEDSDEQVDDPTANLHLKLLLFRKTIGCVMLPILLLMEWKTSHLLTKNVVVTNFNTNDHHKNFVSSSTISFIAINYSPKIGGIG